MKETGVRRSVAAMGALLRTDAHDLLVGIPRERPQLDLGTGAGRVWNETLRRLGDLVTVETLPGRRRLGRGKRPDVWLANGHEGPVEEPEPVVVVNHGAGWLTEDRFWEMVPRDFAEIFIEATEASIRSADVVIVPSQYTRASLIGGMGRHPKSVVAVAHGVDTSVFRPRPEAPTGTVPAAPGGEVPYVVFASIPSIRQKNLGALKQAIGILAARGLPHTLVIAGGTAGGESKDYLAEIRSDPPGAPGRVAWPGRLDDVALAELMAGAAACCLPSLFESFGLTALEALACGAPTVVSDRGALPEVVGDAGLVTSPDPESLADALERVLLDADLSRRLRAAGPARAAGFSWDRTAAGWLSALRRAAGS